MYVKDRHLDTPNRPDHPVCTLLNPSIGWGERKWIDMMCKLVFMSAIPLISVWSGEWGTFYVYILFSLFPPSNPPPHHCSSIWGRGLHRCLNFWGVGIGLLLWEVGGLGLPFSCVPPLCSLSDHFLLLSVHKYKKKVHMYKFLRSCANI